MICAGPDKTILYNPAQILSILSIHEEEAGQGFFAD